MNERKKLLEVRNLKKHYPIRRGVLKQATGHVQAVDGVSFDLYEGETLGIVGESGSGKSTLGRTLVRLLNPTDGEIIFQGVPIEGLRNRQLMKYRKDMQMIFQDPFSSLNPRMKIGKIVGEPIAAQGGITKREMEERVAHLLEKVGLAPDTKNKYPHEFSGGQRQRIGIARALSLNPKLIIGDEPVSALDMSIQAQVLNLMKDLQEEFGLTYIFIAHDLSVVKHISDRVGVMYLGRMAEIGPKKALYSNPLHPYTQALMSAVPSTDVDRTRERIRLKGEPPNPADPPKGCAFHPRCPLAFERCEMERPEMTHIEDGHYVACHLHAGVGATESKSNLIMTK